MHGLTLLNNFVISTGAYPHFLPRRIEPDHVCALPPRIWTTIRWLSISLVFTSTQNRRF
jgi:hypothetical protein